MKKFLFIGTIISCGLLFNTATSHAEIRAKVVPYEHEDVTMPDFLTYPGAVHNFTNIRTGDDPATGVAYNVEADGESWVEIKKLFDELRAVAKPLNPKVQEQASERKEVKHAGVSFIYSTKDFPEIKIRQEPKQTAQDLGDGIDTGLAPEHFCFNLKDKRPLPALEQGPRYFFPTNSFICAIPLTDPSVKDFGRAYPSLNNAAGNLQKILHGRPSLFNKRRDIPDIPPNNASPSIVSRFQYLNFRSGSGVLFLTQYSNEMQPNPVNNEELTLDFQGITKDGRHYLAARLAITHPSLPKGIDFTDDIERDRQYKYLKSAEKELEGFSEISFQPSLKSLKSLLSSIYIE